MPVYPRKCVFGSILDFPGVRKSIIGVTFSTKKGKREQSTFPGGATLSRLGRDLAPKAVQGPIFINFDAVFGRCGLNVGPFWKKFG